MSGKIVRAELVCRIESGLLQIVGAQLLQARFYHAASALKLGEKTRSRNRLAAARILAVGICCEAFARRAFAYVCLNQFRLAGREQQAAEIAGVEVSPVLLSTHDAMCRMRADAQQQMTDLDRA